MIQNSDAIWTYQRRSCCRAPERCWDHRVADADEIVGLEHELPHSGAS
jgi:hypothetical protein